MKKNILVLCTGNSCRSQIAEGYLRHFTGSKAEVYSAGIEIHGVNPRAIETMMEDNIDISKHTSNHVDEYLHIPFDFVITVCDNAKESCPLFIGETLTIHHNFTDPAKFEGNKIETNLEFAKVRDQIKMFCRQFSDTYFLKESKDLLQIEKK